MKCRPYATYLWHKMPCNLTNEYFSSIHMQNSTTKHWCATQDMLKAALENLCTPSTTYQSWCSPKGKSPHPSSPALSLLCASSDSHQPHWGLHAAGSQAQIKCCICIEDLHVGSRAQSVLTLFLLARPDHTCQAILASITTHGLLRQLTWGVHDRHACG